MTYFIRDDNGPFDRMAGMEIDAQRDALILAKNHGQEIGCLFPDDHDPRHPVSMRFHVCMEDERGRRSEEWEDLTEREMMERYIDGATGAMMSSQFEFWYD